MSEAADDVWVAAFDREADERIARRHLVEGCPRRDDCPRWFTYEEGTLLTCHYCGRSMDT